MARKKKITQQDILGFYMDFVLENNERPKSVYALAKAYNFEEQAFYNYFGTIEVLDQQVFLEFFNSTLEVLNKSEDYQSYDSRHQLLSFYYTFFENLTANRSFVKYILSQHSNQLKNLKMLSHLRKSFKSYVKGLHIDLPDFKNKQIDSIQTKGLEEAAWAQLLFTLKFWMDDHSANFEKTDIFIEKSVNASFDLMDISALKSLIDLGKFIIKEKSIMN
ncbi:heat-shock protein [Hanstruepera neustonica]|uniref:Heat-shock protein n=1 Tax=Hanstruepera neustonica TaxID=1445657 RepID=A0A2K1DX83_9FLAO|nr:TetR family transcriptional regulator C-terminal domain-containing protein [Hanstruepera neustonica]PNQ72635.1 heat-shock protein [Hanstruepera neustonica]